MGLLEIWTTGSFPEGRRGFTAETHGHAHAVAQAIQYLSEEVLPEAIERDHRLHENGEQPDHGFDRPVPPRKATDPGGWNDRHPLDMD